MKQLYLLRHAKAETSSATGEDFDRSLNQRGISEARAMGAYMAEHFLSTDYIICSSAFRTRQTLDNLLETRGIKPDINYNQSIYEADYNAYINAISSIENQWSHVMIVGHNPTIMQVALSLSHLVIPPAARKLATDYPAGSLTVIQFNVDKWSEVARSKGILERFISPQDTKMQ